MAGKRLTTVGWREWVGLPDWKVRIRAKLDTGARTSSLDVKDLVVRKNGTARFTIPLSYRRERNRRASAEVVRVTRVKSSNGVVQRRVVVKTRMLLAGREHDIEVTLACRKDMRHRMLLGREALKGVYQIDPGREFVTGKPEA